MSQSIELPERSLRGQFLLLMLPLRKSSHLPTLHKRSDQFDQHFATLRDSSLVTLSGHVEEHHSSFLVPLPEFRETRVVDEIAKISPRVFREPDINVLAIR